MSASYVTREKSHIEKRRNGYFAVMDVPAGVRILGKKNRPVRKLTATLRTDSPAIAEKRAAPIIARWRRQIEAARGQHVETDAEFFRRMLTADELAAIAEIRSVDLGNGTTVEMDATTGAVLQDEAVQAEAGSTISFDDGTSRRLNRTSATRTLGAHFDDLVTEWSAAKKTTAKTKDMCASDIKEFATRFRSVAAVNKPAVKAWTADLIADGITTKTMQRKLSALRGYWKHLQSVSKAPEGVDPFHALDLPKRAGRVRREDKRQPFTAPEVVKLMADARERDELDLVDLIDLARWTGMRIEEACAIRIEDAKLGATIPHFTINAGKTDAAIREVPIHSSLLPVIERLVKDSKDGYLITGQPENKYHDRSNALGKRFGRLKTEMGFGKNHVFHSIRKTVSTIFENASVGENVAADIIGHDKPTMTYGLYSGGTSLEVKREAVEKLSYPGN